MSEARRRCTRAAVVCLVVVLVTACTASTNPGKARGPEQAARAFVEAIGSGRAGDALALLRVQPVDRALVTDDVLADAVRELAISGVTATARGGDGRSRLVDVAYTIGDEHVTDTYTVVRIGQHWFVDEILPTVPVFSDRPGYAAVTVNGKDVVPTDPDQFRPQPSGTPILPGRYRFGLDHPMLDVERADFTITSLHAAATLTGDGPKARLTPDASTQVAAAAAQAMDACLDVTAR
ncbi:MAG: hypothetical protein FWD11_09155, partial [Micrococcales bacterium]|nr:hypothetical protein [Micrococcales bacterium]